MNAKKILHRAALICVFALLFFSMYLFYTVMLLNVPTSSMSPSITPGSVVFVNTRAYKGAVPSRWDIVVFHPPVQGMEGQLWCMRVAGLPSERFRVQGGEGIFVNDLPLRHPNEHVESSIQTNRFAAVELIIPPNNVFVIGDNIVNARDSRIVGPIPITNIVGKAMWLK